MIIFIILNSTQTQHMNQNELGPRQPSYILVTPPRRTEDIVFSSDRSEDLERKVK